MRVNATLPADDETPLGDQAPPNHVVMVDIQGLRYPVRSALDPAYVHITRASLAETARLREALAARGVHSVGRYGGWTYCSIEDNLLETRALAAALAP